MTEQPTLSTKDEVPPVVKDLCEKVHNVADGLPCLIFIPNADHSRLYPVVVVAHNATTYAAQINAYLLGEKLSQAPATLREKHDLTLEAIHAAADYLPAIVFLPQKQRLHPVNLVSEIVADHLKPCYNAVQLAQKKVIGTQPIVVASL